MSVLFEKFLHTNDCFYEMNIKSLEKSFFDSEVFEMLFGGNNSKTDEPIFS